jgi:hypothetical protein
MIDPALQRTAFGDSGGPVFRGQSGELLPMPATRGFRGTTTAFDGPPLIPTDVPPPAPSAPPAPPAPHDPFHPVLPEMPDGSLDVGFDGMAGFADHFGAGDGVAQKFCNCVFFETEYLLWCLRDEKIPPLVTTGLSPAMLTLGSFGSQVVLGGNSEDTGAHSGLRLRAGFWLDTDHSIGFEASYFVLNQEDKTFSATSLGSPALGIPFVTGTGAPSAFPLAGPGFMGGASAQLMNRLWGAEANLRHNVTAGPGGYVDVIGGFRVLGLDDNFTFDAASTVTGVTPLAFSDSFATRNRIYLGQIGAEAERQWGPWSMTLTGKLGLGGNDNDIEIHGTTVQGRTFNGGLFASGANLGKFKHDNFVFVPELGLKLGYQFNNCVRATLGYNFLYVNKVGRAAEQIDQVLGGNHPAFIYSASSFWAQGLTAGLEFRY